MKLVFREIRADEVEKEVTQRDQFNSDEVELIEALVREAHQNSLDARLGNEKVRTLMRLHDPLECDRQLFQELFNGLEEHLEGCGIDHSNLNLSMPRFLVIEDFGTCGLRGAWDQKDELPFSDFWRRVGKSHKGGQQGGRWGLGKLVFSGASQIRCFFGLTISSSASYPEPLLLGQAVLATHKDRSGTTRDAHGFFCEPRSDGFQLPIRDSSYIERFRSAVGFTRVSEPGLSIAIPFPRNDISPETLLPQLVRNYFFPVLMGSLAAQIGQTAVGAANFDSLAIAHGGPELRDGRLVKFIGDLKSRVESGEPQLILPSDWMTRGLQKSFEDAVLEKIRVEYARGELIHLRAPITLRHRKRGQIDSHFDLFVRATDGEGYALVVRGAITLPLEAREFRNRRALGGLIATHEGVVEFLGDAENPAHTKWNGKAEKLNGNWSSAAQRLREIRSSLNAFADLLMQAHEKVDKNAFIEVISLPGGDVGGAQDKKRKKITIPPNIPKTPLQPRKFRIQERRGGFAIKNGAGLTGADLPLEIQVSAAYDVLRGNPLKKHNPLDFDFTKNEISLDATGAMVSAISPNTMRVLVRETEFSVEASGFDINRDLVVRAVR